MKKIKNYISILVTVLLAFTIIITIFSGFVRFVLTDKDMYLNLLSKTDTYTTVKNELYKKMDSILGSSSTDKLKESIITDEDIKNEADVVLTSLINDLKSGQNLEPQIDTTVYRDRIAKALNSLTGYGIKLEENGDLTSRSQDIQYSFTMMNMSYNNRDYEMQHNDLIVKDYGNNAEDVILSNMATRAEIEAKGRAMLKEKGITEEQARQKLQEKGMSEEQVWDYLKKNGYLDEDDSKADSTENSSNDVTSSNDNKPDAQEDRNINFNSDQNSEGSNESSTESNSSEVSGGKIDSIVMPIILDKGKTFDEKMDEISSKLLEYAQSIIDSEVDKLNFSKLFNSQKVIGILKITSFLYNIFFECLFVMVILTVILIMLNKDKHTVMQHYCGKAVLSSGTILTLIFGSAYLFKFYKKIDLGDKAIYFKPMFFATADYFSKILFIISIVILAVGLIMNIFMIKKRITRR